MAWLLRLKIVSEGTLSRSFQASPSELQFQFIYETGLSALANLT